jgi:hypothetical protein
MHVLIERDGVVVCVSHVSMTYVNMLLCSLSRSVVHACVMEGIDRSSKLQIMQIFEQSTLVLSFLVVSRSWIITQIFPMNWQILEHAPTTGRRSQRNGQTWWAQLPVHQSPTHSHMCLNDTILPVLVAITIGGSSKLECLEPNALKIMDLLHSRPPGGSMLALLLSAGGAV